MLFGRASSKLTTCNYVKALQLPEANETKFSFCASAKPARVKIWIDELPVTNAANTSALLYKALPEFAKVQMTPATRAELLEYVRQPIVNCNETILTPLAQSPLNLSETQKKAVVIAQALQKYMVIAYCRCAIDLSLEKKPNPAVLASYLHRAMTGLCALMKSNYQFYTPVPSELWAMTNALFRIAMNAQVKDINVVDPINHKASGTVAHAYGATLALACANPFQLRPVEINQVYNILLEWSKFIDIHVHQDGEKSLFSVLSCSDQEPDYSSTFDPQNLSDDGLTIDFSNLINLLNKSDDAEFSTQRNRTLTLRTSLKDHLSHCWGQRIQRLQQREECDKNIEVCLGISRIHSLLLNGASFDSFIYGSNDEADVYSTSWVDNQDKGNRFETPDLYLMEMTNTGDNGFQLRCNDSIPPNLQAGELIAYREPGKRNWHVGAVRWVRRSDKSGVQFGVQTLAEKVEALGACTVTDNGNESDFMRVLMVRNSLTDGTESLVIPHLPFSERYPITLAKRGQQRKVQLGQMVMATGAFSQFFFRELK
ncbi:hypothetical protein [Sessilibacter sp. MAH2]